MEREWRRSPIAVTLPRVRPRPGTATVEKRDSVNVSLPRRSDTKELNGLQQQQPQDTACSVCTSAVASYACPRCRVAYCSAECFRRHGEACTEAFYRRHVEKEMSYRAADAASEDKRRVAGMLTRARLPADSAGNDAAGEDGGGAEDLGGIAGSDEADLTLERLAELVLQSETGKLDPSALTEEEKRSFSRAFAAGELTRDVTPWKPWWSGGRAAVAVEEIGDSGDSTLSSGLVGEAAAAAGKEAVAGSGGGSGSGSGGGSGSGVGVDEEEERDCPVHTLRGLRRELAAAPPLPLAALGGGNGSAAAAAPPLPSPLLPHLAVDVTFAYAHTLRLYNGCWCDDPLGAAESFCSASPVLSAGVLPASATAALDGCLVATARAFRQEPAAGAAEGASSAAERARIFRRDVCALWEDPRLLLCALRDARGLFEAAAKEAADAAAEAAAAAVPAAAASREASTGSGSGSRSDAAKAARREARRVGALAKRLGYFESWAAGHGAAACAAQTPALLAAAAIAEEAIASVAAGAGRAPAEPVASPQQRLQGKKLIEEVP